MRGSDGSIGTYSPSPQPYPFQPGPVPPEENDLGPFYANEYATITAIAPSRTDPNTIYVGTDTGRLWKTTDQGATWTEFTGKGLPQRWVTRVAIDPRDEDVAYATFSGFRNGEDAAHVFRTTDGGATWSHISGNLPNAPANDVVVDTERDAVHVGTDVGVYSLNAGETRWRAEGAGLPLAPVLDLRLHAPSDTLYAGTFGRSAWSLDLSGS